jgi:formylglycine-generating enzyme required for sulfatase activity
MKVRTLIPLVAVLFAAFAFAVQSRAQSPLVTIDTVAVGDPGNAADTTGYGAVTNVFAIGKYEVTISQYATFLNSVASVTSDSYIVDLWNVNMMDNNPSIAGISRSGAGIIADPYVYAEIGPVGLTPPGASSAGDRPISYVSWFDAARFANWMNNGATNGASTETGAYTLNGATSGIFAVNPGATWSLPSEDQWYKAAYYKGGGTNAGYWLYPTQSDAAPGNTIGGATNQANYNNGVYAVTQSGTPEPQNYLTDVGAFSNSASAYGTYDQGGNLFEWNSDLGFSGSSWYTSDLNLESSSFGGAADPSLDLFFVGFRVATVPEPSTYALLAMSAAGALWWARRRR